MRKARQAAILTLALVAAPPLAAQEPSLKAVMQRTGVYVTEFRRQLSSMVSEESYVQEVRPLAARPPRTSPSTIRRELRSDFLLRLARRRRSLRRVPGRVRGRREAGAGSTAAADRARSRSLALGRSGDSADHRRKRPLQYRHHRTERQHADVAAAVSRTGQPAALPFQARVRSRSGHHAHAAGIVGKLHDRDRGLGGRVPGRCSARR